MDEIVRAELQDPVTTLNARLYRKNTPQGWKGARASNGMRPY